MVAASKLNKRIIATLVAFLCPSVQGAVGLSMTTSPSQMEFNGNAPNNGSLVQVLNELKNKASPTFGTWNFNAVTGSNTLTTAQTLNAFLIVASGPGATTQTTPTGTQLFNATPGAQVGNTFPLIIANNVTGTMTLTGGTGVTLTGTTSIAAASVKIYLGQLTSTTQATITEVFGFASTVTY